MLTIEKICDECGSNYFEGTSEMMSMCAECAHWFFGYPNCQHQLDNGTCVNCGWDGSRSKLLTQLLKRHNMTDTELRDELVFFDQRMKELPRFQEVEVLMGLLVAKPMEMVALSCMWRIDEYADTQDGLIDLKVMLNQKIIVDVEIPTEEDADVEHTPPCLMSDYLDRNSSSDCRQIKIAMDCL